MGSQSAQVILPPQVAKNQYEAGETDTHLLRNARKKKKGGAEFHHSEQASHGDPPPKRPCSTHSRVSGDGSKVCIARAQQLPWRACNLCGCTLLDAQGVQLSNNTY